MTAEKGTLRPVRFISRYSWQGVDAPTFDDRSNLVPQVFPSETCPVERRTLSDDFPVGPREG